MAIPVYVQSVTTYPGRTEWSDTTDYVVGDRVYFSDSISTNSVYVCIQDHSISGGGTAQQPDVTPNYWQPAGSKEYPFMSGNDGELAKADYNASELTLRATNEFNPQWDPARTLSVSDGSTRAHVILMDGTFNLAHNEYYSLLDTDFFAENFQKSWLLFRYYDSNTTTPERSPSLNNLKIGLHNPKVSFESPIILNSCLISDSSPYSTRTSFKITHRFQYIKFTQAKDCLFDFSMCRNNNFMYTPTTSSVHGQSFLKNTTVILGGQETQYGGIFYQAGNLIVDKCIFYIKGLVDLPTPLVAGSIAPKMTNSCVFGESFAGTDYFGTINDNLNIGQVDGSNLLNVDPQFIDVQNSDYRLRPSSPLIGGAGSKDKRSKIESQYPQGKWFDSSAADGGDGAWDTPYNNYAEAIDSFTGDEAVVLIKEGQHPLHSGYWSATYTGGNSPWNPSHDLPKTYPSGIKFIGMGSGSIFDTSGDGIVNFGAFWSESTNNPNSRDTPFLFKDFDILLNNSGYINRGMICCRRAEYINVNVTQAPNLGAINSQLFDYTTSSGSGDSGEYLKMNGCTINVSVSNNAGNSVFFVGQSGGLKQYSNCTFADLHRTTSMTASGSPNSFVSIGFGGYPGSYIKDCIFYSKAPNIVHFGTSASSGANQGSGNLEVKNCAVFNTQVPVSIGSNYGDGAKELDPKFVATEPHDFDLRLRADSPLIGGITKYSDVSTSIWYVDLINGDDTNDGKTPDTAMLTISAAHDASIHLDTIFIVNENITLSSDLDFPGGRKYQALTKCTINFNDNYSSSISAAAGLDTHIKGFNFIKMRGGSSLLSLLNTDVNSLFVIESCKFEGILTSSQSAPIGGNGPASRSARQGSMIKGCSFDIGWSTQMTRGADSSGFIAVDRTDIISCTFWVKDTTPLGSTVLYLVGTGGQGSHSHGPPIGPIEVKNCIVHGNDRMHYGYGSSGDGGNLGFTSNARVHVNDANYIIHNCCLYGINGDPMEIDNPTTNNRYNNGSIISDRNIPREWIENIILEDPQLVDPQGGNFSIKPLSPLIGQGK